MRIYHTLPLLALIFGCISGCDSGNEKSGGVIYSAKAIEIHDRYQKGLEYLKKGDSCMVYWNWSIVAEQYDPTFKDSLNKFKISKCNFVQ